MRNLANAIFSIIIDKYSHSYIIDNIEILNNSLINIDALSLTINETILISLLSILTKIIAIYRDILEILSIIEVFKFTFKVTISKIVSVNISKL